MKYFSHRVFIVSLFLIFFSCPVFLSGPFAQEAEEEEIDNETCLMCHSDPSEKFFIDPDKFNKSIHGDHLCTSCHGDITEVPHDSPLKPVSCASCHTLETEVYLHSDHGIALKGGNTEAASCRNCHGNAHSLLNSRDPQSPVFRNNITNTCGQCHFDNKEMAKYNLHQDKPVLSYKNSVHGLAIKEKGVVLSAVCTDCHGSHNLHRSTNPDSKLYWQNIPTTCGKCHENVSMIYSQSIHGQAVQKGKRDAPVCTDCHGQHTIQKIGKESSKVFSSKIPETCAQCHASERINSKYNLPSYVVDTYMSSYHGLAVQLGSVTAANCTSCHGFHNILPHTDRRSTIHPENLPQTCGKCHAGVGELVTKGQIHAGMKAGIGNKIALLVRRFYLILIISIISLMLIHNSFDFFKKLKVHHSTVTHGKRSRMGVNERIQHGFLAFSFILLAYTGFTLVYPKSWWALPLIGGIDWRSLGHRLGAVIFCVLSVYHCYFVAFTKNGRKHFKLLLPRKIDVIQCGQSFQYYFGKRKEKPAFGFYGYIEKLEYWALVWGSMIMIVTGALMIRETWFLSNLPKWLFDVVRAIHFYEAILACLAIFLWHGYFVMFDPDEYPMKWTWYSGEESEADEERKTEENE